MKGNRRILAGMGTFLLAIASIGWAQIVENPAKPAAERRAGCRAQGSTGHLR